MQEMAPQSERKVDETKCDILVGLFITYNKIA